MQGGNGKEKIRKGENLETCKSHCGGCKKIFMGANLETKSDKGGLRGVGEIPLPRSAESFYNTLKKEARKGYKRRRKGANKKKCRPALEKSEAFFQEGGRVVPWYLKVSGKKQNDGGDPKRVPKNRRISY